MALISFRWRRILRTSISAMLGCGCLGAIGTLGLSALLNWDPSGNPATPGGSGNWDYSSPVWDNSGVLVRWTDVTGVDTGVFKGTGDLVHLSAPITANGLRFDVTGYLIDNNGTPANTLNLVNATVGGPAPLITSNAANVISIISASIVGNDGLQFTAGGLTGSLTKVTGDNKLIGGVTISSGTVELGHAGALNQTIANSLTLGPTLAATLRLNGNSVTIRDLSGATTNSSLTNGAAANAILTIHQQADKLVKTLLSDGSTGTLAVVKAGPATLTLGNDSTYTGATTVRGGTLELAGNNVGRLTATSDITLSDGGTLRLTNSSVANNGDRIPAVPIVMRGGTFAFSSNASAVPVAETAGALSIQAGTNTIFADQAATGQTSTLTFTSLARSQGAIVTFQSNFDGNLTPRAIGSGLTAAEINRDRIVFTTAPILNDGMLGGWAIYDSDDFATYNTTTATSVKPITPSLNLDQSGWLTNTNVKIDQSGSIVLSDPTLTGTRTVNSLNLANDPITIDLSGLTLNIDTGGLISQVSGPFGGTITNGNLTAGSAAGTDLHIRTPNAGGTLTVDATIINSGVGQVNATGLVKSGPGTLNLTNQNTYTGPTAIVGGTIQIDQDNRLGGLTGTPTLKLYDGTLAVSNSFTLNQARSIEIGGNSFISVAAGTTGLGKILNYNGGISSLSGTEGNLSILSNASELSTGADSGKINFALTGVLAITGSLRIDAAVQFKPSAAVPNTIGRSLQIGTNGSALFIQQGNTLTVGNGIDDTLDIGLKDAATFSAVAKVGTLTLTGVTQFTAKVDKMRVGVQTQSTETAGFSNNVSGAVTLATNNDISAGTDITVSDNANAAGSTLTASTITFGGGLNNVTTQNILIGGRRGTGTITVPVSGTLNLRGFGERTLNLSLGRSDLSDTIIPSSGTFTATATNATVTGSFDSIVVGSKTGSTTSGKADGTFSLGSTGAHSIVANSLKLGVHTGFTGTAVTTTAATGTLNMGGGNFTVYNDVVLGTQANNGTSTGTLNLTGGTFNVGGNITHTASDRSMGVINVNGATLNMRNPLVGDTTSGTITASQLNFSAGGITFTSAINLDGRGVTNGATFGPLADALTVRDVTLAVPINLTGTTADKGGIHYLNAGNGAGATLASVSLGGVARTFNVENSTVAADLTITGAVTGAFPITKSGTGTVLLNGPVDGSATIVGGALGGTGTITGSVSVGALGTLTPAGANNIGTLTTGELISAANSTLALDINFVNRTADRLNVNGNLTLNTSASPPVLSLTDLNPIGAFSFFTLTIVDYSGTWNGGLFSVGGVVIDDFDATTNFNSASFFVGPNRYKIDYNFNSGDRVVLISVPEPGSLALAAGGLALLGGMRGRRRR